MEKYFSYIDKSLLLIGIDFTGRFDKDFKVSMVFKFLNYLHLVFLILGFIQMSFYFIYADPNDPFRLDTAFFMILANIAISRMLMLLKHLDAIKGLILQIDETYKMELNGKNHDNGKKFAKFMAKIALAVLWSLGSIPWIVLIAMLIKMIFCYVKDIQQSELFVFGLYFSYNPYDYLPWTLIYFYYIEWISAFPTLIFDQMIISYTTSYLAICYDKLADDISDVINETSSRVFLDTKQKLERCIDIHNKLNDFCMQQNQIFKFALLNYGTQTPLMIAIHVYRAVGKGLQFSILVPFILLQSLNVFYAGQKLKENSLRIAELIAESDIHNFDKSLKQYLILIMRISQKPRTLNIDGFVTFDLGTFKKLVNTVYSYWAILSQIYY